jgi:acyl-coenzyme A thioesterase PaaI-like protein
VRALGRVTRLGGRSAFVEGLLTDDAGTDVARAHGVWRVWRVEG